MDGSCNPFDEPFDRLNGVWVRLTQGRYLRVTWGLPFTVCVTLRQKWIWLAGIPTSVSKGIDESTIAGFGATCDLNCSPPQNFLNSYGMHSLCKGCIWSYKYVKIAGMNCDCHRHGLKGLELVLVGDCIGSLRLDDWRDLSEKVLVTEHPPFHGAQATMQAFKYLSTSLLVLFPITTVRIWSIMTCSTGL